MLTSGEGAIKSSVVDFGLWNSLNTGCSGTDGPSGTRTTRKTSRRVELLFGGGIAFGAGYMVRTSPTTCSTRRRNSS